MFLLIIPLTSSFRSTKLSYGPIFWVSGRQGIGEDGKNIIYFCNCVIEVLEVFYVSPCISDTLQDKID